MKDVRQLRISGQIVKVNPGETIEVEKAVFDKQVFEEIEVKKSNDKNEKPTKKEEVK